MTLERYMEPLFGTWSGGTHVDTLLDGLQKEITEKDVAAGKGIGGNFLRIGEFQLMPSGVPTTFLPNGPQVTWTLPEAQYATEEHRARLARSGCGVETIAAAINSLLDASKVVPAIEGLVGWKELSNFRVALDFYPVREKVVGFHKDSAGRTLFVILAYNNRQIDNLKGPEWIPDAPSQVHGSWYDPDEPSTYGISFAKLPGAIRQKLANARNAWASRTVSISGGTLLPGKAMVRFCDPLIFHCSPYPSSRGISAAELVAALKEAGCAPVARVLLGAIYKAWGSGACNFLADDLWEDPFAYLNAPKQQQDVTFALAHGLGSRGVSTVELAIWLTEMGRSGETLAPSIEKAVNDLRKKAGLAGVEAVRGGYSIGAEWGYDPDAADVPMHTRTRVAPQLTRRASLDLARTPLTTSLPGGRAFIRLWVFYGAHEGLPDDVSTESVGL